MKLTRLFMLALLFLLPGITAQANPISVDFWEALQTPESYHVQITFYYLSKDGSISDVTVKNPAGETLALASEQQIDRNGGSGVMAYQTKQFCLCDATPGQVALQVSFVGGDEAETYAETLRVTVTDPPPPVDTTKADADYDIDEESPNWEPGMEADGPWPKGVDCTSFCSENPGGLIDGDADGLSIDDEGGCSQAQAGGFALLLCALLLGAGYLRTRRS